MLAGPDDVDRFGKRSSDGVLLEASRILNAEGKTQAIKYVRRVEELVGCPVALLSTSPEREDTILMKNPFEL